VLVDHRERRIELWARRDERWEHTVFGAERVLELDCVRCSLAVDELYAAADEGRAASDGE
jgi:hypothetical protein